jgi:predicted molibdopterin-dependent oxidoreductase YjgC
VQKFRRRSNGKRIHLILDGRGISAVEGDTVAAALLQTGIASTRTTPKRAQPRAPYCLMGACFDCLMTIDGVANRQACLVTVKNGMSVERQTITHLSDWA